MFLWVIFLLLAAARRKHHKSHWAEIFFDSPSCLHATSRASYACAQGSRFCLARQFLRATRRLPGQAAQRLPRWYRGPARHRLYGACSARPRAALAQLNRISYPQHCSRMGVHLGTGEGHSDAQPPPRGRSSARFLLWPVLSSVIMKRFGIPRFSTRYLRERKNTAHTARLQ